MGNLVSAENVEPTKQKMKKEKNMASNIEVLGHALGGVGQNTVYALWSGFITAFYTDVFGMNQPSWRQFFYLPGYGMVSMTQ